MLARLHDGIIDMLIFAHIAMGEKASGIRGNQRSFVPEGLALRK